MQSQDMAYPKEANAQGMVVTLPTPEMMKLIAAGAERGMSPAGWLARLAFANLNREPHWSQAETAELRAVASAVQHVTNIVGGLEPMPAAETAIRLCDALNKRLDTMIAWQLTYWGLDALETEA